MRKESICSGWEYFCDTCDCKIYKKPYFCTFCGSHLCLECEISQTRDFFGGGTDYTFCQSCEEAKDSNLEEMNKIHLLISELCVKARHILLDAKKRWEDKCPD